MQLCSMSRSWDAWKLNHRIWHALLGIKLFLAQSMIRWGSHKRFSNLYITTNLPTTNLYINDYDQLLIIIYQIQQKKTRKFKKIVLALPCSPHENRNIFQKCTISILSNPRSQTYPIDKPSNHQQFCTISAKAFTLSSYTQNPLIITHQTTNKSNFTTKIKLQPHKNHNKPNQHNPTNIYTDKHIN